jgi:hypothetical protein
MRPKGSNGEPVSTLGGDLGAPIRVKRLGPLWLRRAALQS